MKKTVDALFRITLAKTVRLCELDSGARALSNIRIPYHLASLFLSNE